MEPIKLKGLYPQAYEHPDDAAALDALKQMPGFEPFVRKVNSWGIERLLRIQYTGSSLHVTKNAFPHLWDMLSTVIDRLSLPIRPELYVTSGEEINAFTAGVESPIIVFNRGTIEQLKDDELMFVMAHEVGHIKSGHVLYYTIASYIPLIIREMGGMIGNLVSQAMQIALLHWQRTSELTADRAGLLCCQDSNAALRTTMKLAGMPHRLQEQWNIEEFIKQAKDFDDMDSSTVDKLIKLYMGFQFTHPWVIHRAKEMLRWIESGGYDRVLRLPYPLPTTRTVEKRFCDACGDLLKQGSHFCNRCGQKVDSLPNSAGQP